MIAIIGIGVAALVAGVLGFGATKPDTFRVERKTSIKAPPEKIFALINDFHRWGTWSPWEKLDPALQRTYSGAENGRGAVYAWEGNRKVGSGRMEITDSVSPSKVALKLDFLKPFEAHNTTEFTLERRGDFTDVTWAMLGSNIYVSKVMSVFMNMDQMIGKDFEAGLANMKSIAES